MSDQKPISRKLTVEISVSEEEKNRLIAEAKELQISYAELARRRIFRYDSSDFEKQIRELEISIIGLTKSESSFYRDINNLNSEVRRLKKELQTLSSKFASLTSNPKDK